MFGPLLAALWLGAAPQELRYLALGDSFTIGTGTTPDRSFPARLAAHLHPSCRVTLLNPAVNGFTTQDLIDHELPRAAAFAPGLVTLAIGANDLVRGRTVEQYRGQLGRIYDQLAASGIPASRVVALPQPDWSTSPIASTFGAPADLHARIVSFNEALRVISEGRGARYLDLFPLMEEQGKAGMVAPDGLHPSAGAYEAWALALVGAAGKACGPAR